MAVPDAAGEVCGSGPCYATHAEAGCANTTCCQAVCNFDEACCSVAWDANCVATAESVCLPMGICGLSTAGSCFSVHANPACNDVTCCQSVCAADPICCLEMWDGVCAQQALVLCGEPGGCGTSAFSCTQVHPGGGCSDAACCELICGLQPTCCSQAWDQACVAAATCYCYGGCTVSCPANSIQEFEVCGQKTNDPCYNPGSTVMGQSISTTLPICGRLFVEVLPNGTKNADVDIFVAQLGVDGSGSLTTTLSLTSKNLAWAALVPAPPFGQCNPLAMALAHVQSQNTLPGTVQACVPAGKYWVVVSAGVFPQIGQGGPFACADGRYVVGVTTAAGCVSPCATSVQSCFVPHAEPGCGSPAGCCQSVCAVDPYCCGVEWDGTCVASAASLCAGTPPANNQCVDAQVVELGTTPISTLFATADGPTLPASCSGAVPSAMSSDVWFSFLASRSGMMRVSTCQASTFDTRLAVHAGDACPPTTLIACNDNDPQCTIGTRSTVMFSAECGETYLIQVGGHAGGVGVADLTIEEIDAVDCCPGDANNDGVVDGGDLAIILGNWGASQTGDLNGDGVVDGSDLALVLGNWGLCPR